VITKNIDIETSSNCSL